MLKPNPQSGGVRKQGLWDLSWEQTHHKLGFSAVKKEAPERPLPPSAIWGYSEKPALCDLGQDLSSDRI